MRRDELAALGIQLPVLPTVVLGGLPGPPEWAPRLERIGLDVLASGARADTPATWSAAAAANPYRPTIGTPGDAEALALAGCRLLAGAGPAVPGAYRIGDDDRVVVPVAARLEVEPADGVAAAVVEAIREGEPAAMWVAAGPGLDALDEATAEAKLAVLVEGTRRARLWLVKRQVDY